jgi:hypothetical protein
LRVKVRNGGESEPDASIQSGARPDAEDTSRVGEEDKNKAQPGVIRKAVKVT